MSHLSGIRHLSRQAIRYTYICNGGDYEVVQVEA